MRAVLIAISEGAGGWPDEAGQVSSGRPLPLRQLDFALACGCEEVLALGAPGSEQVALLSRTARARGAIVRLVGHAHELLGLLNATDELLVLDAHVLPESPVAVTAMSGGPRLLVLPADVAVPAGFERIDRDLAWAGAAKIPGRLVERLAELPADSDVPAALLRIALQAQLPAHRLPESVLADGSWVVAEAGAVSIASDGWRRKLIERAEPHDWTGRLARAAVKRWPQYLQTDSRTINLAQTGGVLLLLAAVVLAWYDMPAIGLALLAPATLASTLADLLGRVDRGPFAAPTGRWRPTRLFSAALDAVFGLCGAAAIGGAWLGRLFPPAVLLIALHGRPAENRPSWLAGLSDRMVLSLVAAIAAALDIAEPVLMLLALVFLLGDRKAAAGSD